MELEITSSISE